MQAYILILVAFGSLLVTAVVRKTQFLSELALVLVGSFISFLPPITEAINSAIPFFPVLSDLPHDQIELNPEVILGFILPPILFSSARSLSVYRFKKVFGSVVSLGIFLPIFTGLCVGFLLMHLFPLYITFPVALVIGACVAPPDAISVVAVGSKIGFPEKIMSTIKGESLINDAASLTLFTTALAMLTGETGGTHGNPLSYFMISLFGGIFVGVLFGFIFRLCRKVLEEPSLISVFTALFPFMTYLVAEHFHCSGVIAVVIVGLISQKNVVRAHYSTRIQETELWKTIDTLIETFVFGYIGLQAHSIYEDLVESTIPNKIEIEVAIICLIVVIISRPAFLFTVNFFQRINIRVISHVIEKVDFTKKRMLNKWVQLRYSNLKRRREYMKNTLLSYRETAVISWCGVRGVITLAAASAVPFFDTAGNEITQHATIQLCGYVITVGTLFIQGPTLSALSKWALTGTKKNERIFENQYIFGRMLISEAANEVIDEMYEDDPELIDKDELRNIWIGVQRPGENAKKHLGTDAIPEFLQDVFERQRKLLKRAVIDGDLEADVANIFLNRMDLRQSLYISKSTGAEE
ncbi:MAG: sodium:proton antiporter [Bifidobacteriaceae bacterium]|jgi:CPA1 family monovalent cation:H+ antiporter|nr:sodium:proton antiporter [Bifidobacteriaceae bacterium]